MKQLQLIPIRRQPAQLPAHIPSRVIRSFVRESLEGFAHRQRQRERARKEQAERYNRKGPKTTDTEPKAPTMRSIRITYRAMFEQPTGALNPLNLKLPGRFPVEIFGNGEQWKAREIASPRRVVYERLSRFTSPDAGKQIVEASFTRKVEDWQMWGTEPVEPGGEVKDERIMIPGVDLVDLGGNAWGYYMPADRTHISTSGPRTDSTATAACGATVSFKIVVSTRANVEPTCPKCAEIYKQRYASK
jgi:hypothetical protein